MHTDHKPLTFFTSSDVHEGIYGHWADQLQRLNIKIVYIPGPRNKAADGLSRTIFKGENCHPINDSFQEALADIKSHGPMWIWKDGPGGYNAFLESLSQSQQKEVLTEGTLEGVEAFTTTVNEGNTVAEWDAGYRGSEWFGFVYRFLQGEEKPKPDTLRKAFKYRIDLTTGVMWIHRGDDAYLPCIPETHVLRILQASHDNGGHWGKEGTLAKLRSLVYWPGQSEDVEKYIKGCIQCARHGPATRSQPLHPIKVFHPMQLLGMDWIGPLPTTSKGMIYIFHVICYFTRFSFTFPCATANSSDVVRFLSLIFVQFRKPLAIYCDRGHHFDSEETKTFVSGQGISLSFSASGASKSTGMIEVSNRILEGVMRKGDSVEWDQGLARSTQQVNCRIIHHLQTAPSTILLGLEPSVADLDAKLAFVPPTDIESWVVQISDPVTHARKIRDYCNYRAQTHDRVRQLSSRKKERDAARYDAGVTRAFHELGTMVMIYQKRTAKMEARWRGPFRITGYGGVHGLSWEVSQLNGRKIRGAFHGDHLKPFIERTGYLATGEMFEQSQTVRRRRARKGKK